MSACLLWAGIASAASSAKPGHPLLPPPLPSGRSLQALNARASALLQLDGRGSCAAASVVRRHGGELISQRFGIWRVPGSSLDRLLPTLVRMRALRAAEPDRLLEPDTHLSAGDPLIPDEWWLSRVGADRAEPPGPGRPVTVVDSGVDLSHPEFSGRPNTTALNFQSTTNADREIHGTGVASVVAAPANGIGLVGVYPQAILNVWDASPGGDFRVSDELRGIISAFRLGHGVINISLGGSRPDFLEQSVVLGAFGEGSIVVASAGNEAANGNPPWYPASYNHVLTVASTNDSDRPSFFSSSSRAVDLAAPGERIPIAVPQWFNSSGYQTADGTSFAAPMVAGATAWVWSERPTLDNTQIFELMRRSARDVFDRGRDRRTGFGVLDIPRALAAPPLPPDPQEPNEDVFAVKPHGLFDEGAPFLTGAGHSTAIIRARLDSGDDPEDVYRLRVPAGKAVVVSARGNTNVQLELWRSGTTTVFERGGARRRHLIGASYRRGTALDVAVAGNRGTSASIVYVNAFLAKQVTEARYTLTVRTRAVRRR